MKTVVIVQARLASSRLPNKILLPLGNDSVLGHVLERCKAIRGVDDVCCATVTGIDGDKITSEARDHGVIIYQGSEDDVLDRYYKAAIHCQADIIIRITSDCPLVDPMVCGQVLKIFTDEDVDYACNNMPPTFPHGLDCEIFSFAWLKRAADNSKNSFEREHVTPYIRNHPSCRTANLKNSVKDMSKHRWTLDNKDDYKLLAQIFKLLPSQERIPGWLDILSIVEQYPELVELNQGYSRTTNARQVAAANIEILYRH